MSKNNCFQKKLKHPEIVINYFFVYHIDYLNEKETFLCLSFTFKNTKYIIKYLL